LKPINYLAVAALALFTSTSVAQQSSTIKKSKKTLVWNDEFNKNGLPDTSKWVYEEGFMRNKESQYYTARPENCFVKNGKLTIRSLKENYKTAAYTSASINTFGKKAFTGDFRIEIKAKLPEGKGIWPALWMMGTNIHEVNWPKCFEFDIMEYVGKDPNTIYGTFHWWESGDKDNNKKAGTTIKMYDLHTKFHVYAIERKGDTVSLFIDNKEFYTLAAPPNAYEGSFHGPVYLLMNTAIGGTGHGPIDDSIFPQEFVIDYVRAYQLD
jgi:beta-glucanase (GH16 family)